MASTDDNPPSSSPNLNFDSVLEEIGAFGRFQKLLYFSVCITIIFTTGLGLTVVFSAAIPKTRCLIPNCDLDPVHAKYSDAFNSSTNEFAKFAIPSGKLSQCYEYVHKSSNDTNQCAKKYFDKTIEPCQDKILYDHTYYGSTLMEDFNLACHEEWKLPFVQSSTFVGIMIAAMGTGILADKYGRKHVVMSCLAVTIVSAIFQTFSNSFWMYLFFQMLTSLGQAGFFQTGFILALETVGQSHRVFCGIVIEFFFVSGEVLLTLLAWITKSWRWTMAMPIIPLSLGLFAWPVCPESVRWLLSKGRTEEAEIIVLKMAKMNKCEDFVLNDHKIMNQVQQSSSVGIVKEGFLDVVKTRTLAFRLLNMCFCWLTVTMVYYGLSLNATNLAGSPYTNFLLVALVEIPGYALSYYTMEKIGRSKSTALSLIISGACCLISAILASTPSMVVLSTITFLLGKLGVTWTFGNVYVYTSELFPTSTRTACVGVCSFSGRIGGIAAPYIVSLSSFASCLPMICFGTIAFTSGTFVYLFLPETLGNPLPETISEAIGGENSSMEISVDDQADENTPLLA